MAATAGPPTARWGTFMTLLLLEALGAFLLFIFIVWWTMFAGRKNGELPDDLKRDRPPEGAPDDSPQPGKKGQQP
jgi:hypothetical protein